MSAHSVRALVLTFATLSAVFMLAGCGAANKTTGVSPTLTMAQADDAAFQVGALVHAGGTSSPMPAMLASPTQLMSLRHTQAAAETTITDGGLTHTYTIRWYSPLGREQDSYDPVTTTHMVADSRVTGSFIGPQGTVTIGSTAHLDMVGVGVEDPTLTTNASENDTLHYSASGKNGNATYDTRCTGSFTNVVENKPLDKNYPASGSASWGLEVSKEVSGLSESANEHFFTTAAVTFNGSKVVELVVDRQYHYSLDLDTGYVTSSPTRPQGGQ